MSAGDGGGPSRGVKRSLADAGATKLEARPGKAERVGGACRQQESIYNSLVLLLLRESGAAVELHRLVTAGPRSREGCVPAEHAYERAIEAQRTWVCALARASSVPVHRASRGLARCAPTPRARRSSFGRGRAGPP